LFFKITYKASQKHYQKKSLAQALPCPKFEKFIPKILFLGMDQMKFLGWEPEGLPWVLVVFGMEKQGNNLLICQQ